MENYNAVFIEQKGNEFASVYFDDVNSKHKREMSIDFSGADRFISGWIGGVGR